MARDEQLGVDLSQRREDSRARGDVGVLFTQTTHFRAIKDGYVMIAIIGGCCEVARDATVRDNPRAEIRHTVQK
jgi:hypothetical protein